MAPLKLRSSQRQQQASPDTDETTHSIDSADQESNHSVDSADQALFVSPDPPTQDPNIGHSIYSPGKDSNDYLDGEENEIYSKISSSIKEKARDAVSAIAWGDQRIITDSKRIEKFQRKMIVQSGIPGLGLSPYYLANNLDILTLEKFANGK